MEVGCRVRWFTASTMTLQHQLCSTIPSIFQKSTSTCTDISVRVHPYPHPVGVYIVMVGIDAIEIASDAIVIASQQSTDHILAGQTAT